MRKLHRTFKCMHWNSIRYCIGFPPEMWYRIADEEGLLIEDEFPIWYPNDLAEGIEERGAGPGIHRVDAGAVEPSLRGDLGRAERNVTPETGKAIRAVRGLDLSGRPWDNGWSPPQCPGDCFEAHPYVFGWTDFRLSDFAIIRDAGHIGRGGYRSPVIINEYSWGHLRRTGDPTDPMLPSSTTFSRSRNTP